LPRRNRYQFGSLELRKRTKGPDVWLFRYWDRQNRSETRPSITVGTVEDYPTQADARRAAEGLRLEINNGLPTREAVTFQGLIDRYISEEIERGDLAHTTKEPDLNRINKHILPSGAVACYGRSNHIRFRIGSENCHWLQKPEAIFEVSCTASSRKLCSGN
jgi:hypothetical protein